MDKTALITGANSDIAISIAKKLMELGYNLILTSRNAEKLEQTRTQIGDITSISAFAYDLSSTNNILLLTQKVRDNFQNLDLIVNLAGIYHDEEKAFDGIDFKDYSVTEIEDNLNVGILAPMIIVNQLRDLLKSGSSIINISGTFESAKGWLPYYVSKKALEDFTVGASQEFSDDGIRVNCISPGDTMTESYKKFFPQYATEENCISPEEISNKVEFLVSGEGKEKSGEIIEVKKE